MEADEARLLEVLASSETLYTAWEIVRRNHGAAGVDGITIELFEQELPHRVPLIESELLDSTYHPSPVRAVTVPKSFGGTRELGIPTVADRLVLEGLALLLTPFWEPGFSPRSFAYRPGKSAHDAVALAQDHLQGRLHWVVDLDIEDFFPNVDHVHLMLRLGEKVTDAGEAIWLIGSPGEKGLSKSLADCEKLLRLYGLKVHIVPEDLSAHGISVDL